MNDHEEELQKSIETGAMPAGDDLDIRAYREVFSRLEREPAVHLSSAFTDNIVGRIIEKKKQSTSRDFVWLGAGIFMLVLSLIVAIKMSGFTLNLGFLKHMSGYTGLFIFGVVFIVILNRLDNKFISQGGNN